MLITIEDAKHRLEDFREDIKELGASLKIEEKIEQASELEAKTFDVMEGLQITVVRHDAE